MGAQKLIKGGLETGVDNGNVLMGHPRSFLFYFRLFKQTLQPSQQINVKNVHPVYGAGI